MSNIVASLATKSTANKLHGVSAQDINESLQKLTAIVAPAFAAMLDKKSMELSNGQHSR